MAKTTKAKAARAPAKGKTYGKAPARAYGKASGAARGKPSGAARGKASGAARGKASGAARGKPGKAFRVYGKPAAPATGRAQARSSAPGSEQPKGAAAGGRGGRKAPPRRKEQALRAAPAPARRVSPARPGQPDVARPTALAIAKAALDKKGEEVTVLDVRGLTSYADYFVVVTADSDRQASAIADHVEQTMKEQGVSKVGVEGYEGGRWILVDYGDVVAHVMNKESRGFYDLEGLWADAPRFSVDA